MSKILVVDDARFSRKAVMAALNDSGCEFVQASNGVEALEQVFATDPDVVVSDLLMPEMDGMELLSVLRGRGDQRPVIIVSADIQVTSREECERLGASGFLNKPFQASELQTRVCEALETLTGV